MTGRVTKDHAKIAIRAAHRQDLWNVAFASAMVIQFENHYRDTGDFDVSRGAMTAEAACTVADTVILQLEQWVRDGRGEYFPTELP